MNEKQTCIHCGLDGTHIDLVEVDYDSPQVPTDHGHMEHWIKQHKVSACELAQLYAERAALLVERQALREEVEKLKLSQTTVHLTIHNNYPRDQKESEPLLEQIKQSTHVFDWGI
jgi:hypothetical protein